VSKERCSSQPQSGARRAMPSFADTDRLHLAIDLSKELGVSVTTTQTGSFRVLGYTATDPAGVRRLVKRLKGDEAKSPVSGEAS
jgi:hypothetical protein